MPAFQAFLAEAEDAPDRWQRGELALAVLMMAAEDLAEEVGKEATIEALHKLASEYGRPRGRPPGSTRYMALDLEALEAFDKLKREQPAATSHTLLKQIAADMLQNHGMNAGSNETTIAARLEARRQSNAITAWVEERLREPRTGLAAAASDEAVARMWRESRISGPDKPRRKQG